MSQDIMKYFNDIERPLVGMEYIAILIDDDNTHFTAFKCLACRINEKATLMRNIMKHIESVEHQLLYLVSS